MDRLGKRFKSSRGADEGIMNTRARIEDADKYRYSEEWMKRHAGWPGSGR